MKYSIVKIAINTDKVQFQKPKKLLCFWILPSKLIEKNKQTKNNGIYLMVKESKRTCLRNDLSAPTDNILVKDYDNSKAWKYELKECGTVKLTWKLFNPHK